MLSKFQVREHLALAHTYAIASYVGCSWDVPRVDMDSVDVRLALRNEEDPEAAVRSPEIALQVKGHTAEADERDAISFFLKKKNHEDLIKRSATPRLLVVVALPPNLEECVESTPSQLILRRCAYWLNLLGDAPTDNETGVTVSIPKNQVFDAVALKRLMTCAARQERLK